MAKAAYIGVLTEVPIYETSTITIDSEAKLLQYFTREDEGDYTFQHISNGKFQSNNAGVYEEDEWYDEENNEWVTEEYSPSAYVNFQAINTIENLYFDWSVSSEKDYDFLNISYINYNSSGGGGWTVLVSDASGTQSGTCGPITLYAGDRISLDYSKDNSTDNGNDCGIISNIHWSTSIQTGTTNKPIAKNVNNIYLGVNNVAKQVIKAYIGVGGVARPIWGWESTDFYGTATNLAERRSSLAATSVGGYALFGGGYYHMTGSYNGTITGEDDWAIVDAYNQSLTKTTVSDLSVGRSRLAAATISNHALFVGGYSRDDHEPNYMDACYAVDAYDQSLVRTSPAQLTLGTEYCGATAIGDYALFGGGNFLGYTNKMYAYNKSLVQSLPSALSVARGRLNATTVGNYALFAGGRTSSSAVATVDAYTTTLTLISTTQLSVARTSPCAVTVGNYALFCGGDWSTATCKTVDAYDTNLTRISCADLPTYGMNLAGTTLRDWAIISGGNNVTYDYNATYQYDSSLVRSNLTQLSTSRTGMAATSVGKYALFGGGSVSSNNDYPSDVVDVYTLI